MLNYRPLSSKRIKDLKKLGAEMKATMKYTKLLREVWRDLGMIDDLDLYTGRRKIRR